MPKVKISEITVLADRQRKAFDPKKLLELQESIIRTGLLHPLVVRHPRPEDAARNAGNHVTTPFVLVAGGRRLAAHIALGREEVEITNKETMGPLEQEIAELEENLCRQDISWQEQLEARERIHKIKVKANASHTAEKTAEELGISKGNLSKDLTLAEMIKHDPELKGASTKRAALRLAEHKVTIAGRIMRLEENNEQDLRRKLFCADARDFVRLIPDQSVDLVFTDLPYGIDYKSASQRGGAGASHVLGEYDDDPETIKDLVTDLIPQMCRVLKPGGWMVLFYSIDGMEWLRAQIAGACRVHGEYMIYGLDEQGDGDYCEKGDKKSCKHLDVTPLNWIWYKPNARNISEWPDRYAKHVYEELCVTNGGVGRMIIQNQPDVLVHDVSYENRLHEMQKPHSLCLDVIKRLTLPGELVADFCFGSGAHLAAAASLGRDFIGCDNNPNNLNSALGLVAQHYSARAVEAAKAGLVNSRAASEENKFHEDEAALLEKL